MKRKITACLLSAALGLTACGMPLAASAAETSTAPHQRVSTNSDSGVMPLAEAFPVEGGTWQYGKNLIKAWSNYYHATKPHASTVTSGNKRSVSANTRAGYWSYATLNGFYSSANYYYRVL